MKPLHPPAVYVAQRVLDDERSRRRYERFMKSVTTPVCKVLDDAGLAELVRRQGWDGSRRLSGTERRGDPSLLFDNFAWDDAVAPESLANVGRMRGGLVHSHMFREGASLVDTDGTVCQDGFEMHTARGCLFQCAYCYFEDVLMLAANIEEYLERIGPVILAGEGPALWKWDSQSDTICFEPELGATAPLVDFFARTDDKFLMLYTKSDNVDFLLDLDHRGRTIVCWTLNAHTQSRLIERRSATCEARIEAARKCGQAGYTVRFRFSGVCPVRNWRAENREMIERLFAACRPDVISLQTLSRMPEPGMFDRVMDASIMEPRFVKAVRDAEQEMKGNIWGPLPDDEREEIYRCLIDQIDRVSPHTPVSLCLESPAMWARLADALKVAPPEYPCCCGMRCVPGHPIMSTV